MVWQSRRSKEVFQTPDEYVHETTINVRSKAP